MRHRRRGRKLGRSPKHQRALLRNLANALILTERDAEDDNNKPKVKGRIKKLVRDRGFGFVRGDDGKEVFFHRSGLGSTDYDALSEGDVVEYVVQEGPRGARAENVRAVSEG